MPYDYNDPRQYEFRPTRGQHIASGIGALIAAALAAMQGQNTGDAIARGAAGAVSGYGGSMNAANQEYQDIFNRTLARDKFAQNEQQFQDSMGLNKAEYELKKRKYEETELPESKAQVESYNKFGFFGTPPRSIIEDQYSQGLTPDRRQEFDKYATPISVPILAERAARGDKTAQAALAQVNVPQLYNSDQGVKLINRRTEEIKDTGLTQKPELSDTAIKEIGSLNTLQQSVNDLSILSEKVSMGPAAGRLEQAKGNWFNNLSSNEQLEFNTINQQIFNTIGELRAGKVITENEMSRLFAELPNQNLPYKTYKVRLKILSKYLDRTLENKMKTYEQGNFNIEGIKQQKPIINPQTTDDPFAKYWK